ncbi:MAG: DUF624 domain-containing protein [Lachnospiraceae bacterium]|nr:DUF624 domain-containing protein [Lachnospiraceae bacterium]
MQITNRFMNWYHGNNECENEPPRSGIKRVFYVLMNYTGKIILINIIFWISCIPVITIPAALTALNYYLIKIFQRGYHFELVDYWIELKRNLWKSLPLGCLFAVLFGYTYYVLSLSGNYKQNEIGDMIFGIGIAFFMVASCLFSYCFILNAMLDLSWKNILKNAGILMIVEWKTSFSVVLFSIFSIYFFLKFLPLSIFVYACTGFSIQQLSVCAMIIPIIMKRIVYPFENIDD